MLINNAVITGSFIVNGVDVVGITGSSAISSSFLALSSSYVITSASYAQSSASLSIRTGNLEATSSTLVSASSSFAAQSASFSSRVNIIEGQDATTGSNTFTGVQYISQASNAISFTSTASLYTDGGLRVAKDSFVSGTAYFNNIIVYGTSSIEYITSSQVDIGANIITVNTDTPAVRFGGLSVFDSGSTQLTGSILWDSQTNHWVYSNPSGSSYSGGMIMSGPRSSALGSEQGTTNNALMKGQGGDHITSSQVIDDGTTVRIPGALQVTGSLSGSSATFSSNITATNTVTISSTTNASLVSATNSTTGFTFIDLINNGASGRNYQIGLGGNGAASGYANNLYIDLVGVGTVMTLTSGRNVGIGTSSPVYKLDVRGQGYFATASGTNQLTLGDSTNGTTSAIATSNNNLLFYPDGSNERMRITSGGDVLIGDTSASANLWVKNSGAGNLFGVRNTNASFAATIGFFGADRNTTNNSFYYIDCYNYGSGTYRFRVADSGNVTSAGTISAGVITGDSNSTGVPSIVAKVGGGGNNGTFGFGNDSNYRIRGGSDYGAMIFDTAGAEQMRITGGGTTTLQLGTYTGNSDIQLTASTVGYSSVLFGDGASGTNQYRGYVQYQHNGDYMIFATDSTEKMRITSIASGGYTKISNYGGYINVNGNYHEIVTNRNNENIAYITNTASSPYGPFIYFLNAAPNNTTNYFLQCADASVVCFTIWSNGTTSGRSDIRLKKNVVDATPKLDKLMQLRLVNYEWKESIEGGKELGLIAQEVEEVFPNLVITEPIKKKRGIEQQGGSIIEEEYIDGDTKSIKNSVLPYITIKALQELTTLVQELKAELDTAKTEINELKNK